MCHEVYLGCQFCNGHQLGRKIEHCPKAYSNAFSCFGRLKPCSYGRGRFECPTGLCRKCKIKNEASRGDAAQATHDMAANHAMGLLPGHYGMGNWQTSDGPQNMHWPPQQERRPNNRMQILGLVPIVTSRVRGAPVSEVSSVSPVSLGDGSTFPVSPVDYNNRRSQSYRY